MNQSQQHLFSGVTDSGFAQPPTSAGEKNLPGFYANLSQPNFFEGTAQCRFLNFIKNQQKS
jgi:hypothetical protein